MKLSHRDFRPQRRSKYVSQPPIRRPTLRILLLAAFGTVVYLKFDSFVSSGIFKMLGHPHLIKQALTRHGPIPESTSAQLPLIAATALKWSADSNLVSLDCLSGQIDPCLEAGRELGFEALGSLRALIHKAEVRWDILPTKGFSARFHKVQISPEDTIGWTIQRLELSSEKGSTLLVAQESANPVRYCSANRCLDDSAPVPPFVKYQSQDHPLDRPPQLDMQPLESPVFHSVLPGRVVEILSQPKSVKIYHGRNIFSIYGGFSELRSDLRPGSMVNMGDTLGLVERGGDSLGRLRLRIEKDGLFVDPLAYLGITADTGSMTHGR